MFEQFKKLVGHSAVYGLGLVGSTIGLMILTPMFLHRLSRPEYGMNEVLQVMASMLYVLTSLGISAVYIKVYVNDCETREQQKTLFTSMVLFSVTTALLITLLSLVSAKPVSAILFKSPRYENVVRLAAIGGGIQLILSMINQCLRAKQWAAKFVAVSLVQFVIVIVLNVYFLTVRNMGVFGIQLAAVICFLAAIALGLLVLRSDLTIRFSGKVVSRVLMLSLPVFPAACAPWILNVSDRYFLNHYCGLADTGLYAAGYKIGMVGMFIFITATQYAWPPIFYANSDSKDIARLCANYAKYYLLLLAMGALAFSIFAPEIIRFIAKREYWSADRIVPYIAASYVFYGLQFYSIPFFIKANRGRQLSYIMGGAAIGNLLLNFLLVPRYGIPGAVASTVITFGIEAVLSLGLANRFFPIPYEYANFAKLAAIAGIAYAIFHGIQTTSALSLVLKSSAFPMLLILLFVAGFFSQKELAIIQSTAGKVLRKVFTLQGKA